MKIKYIAYLMALLIAFPSCVEDKGNYDLSPINEIEISGIEDEYNKVSHSESLTITPETKSSLSGMDDSQFEYLWFLSSGLSTITHQVIGTEKNLDYFLEVAPGEYDLYFQVLDKTTGLKWEKYSKLKVLSPFVRGFYLFGDKEDGICGMDFVSMIEGRDTTVIENIFNNSLNIKGAQNLVFTGGSYVETGVSFWGITESGSYSIDFKSTLTEFDIRKDVSAENIIFPTIEITRPLKVMDIYPHAFGANNINLANNSRVLMTENEFFSTTLYGEPEAYGNPLNRYSASSSELYKPSKYVFYPGNSSYVSRMFFYDETNQRFVGLNSGFSFSSNSKTLADTDGSAFYFDQTRYTPVRTLVYGENGYGNAGRSYALMTDADGKYYIYGFLASGVTPSKVYSREVDPAIATDFDKASHYAFFSMQTIILYSVGSQLWAYDYTRKDAKMVKDFGSEITFLAMDFHSNNTPTDFIVATYSPSEKGVVSKFTIADDQNKIEVTPHEKEVWKTNLKVVKVEYRNASI